MYLVALLFLPGTIIHELSHYCMAVILRVQAGHIRLLPEITGTSIKLGTVAIAKTDPMRRFFIGAAPFFFGTTIILLTILLALHYGVINNRLYLLLIGYILFEVGNTMFSSTKDMEGALELLVTIGIVSIVLILVGFRFSIEKYIPFAQLTTLFQTGSMLIAPALFLDIALVTILKIFNRK